MKIAVITPYFTPTQNSTAVQMHDLAQEMIRQGHEPTVFVPDADIKAPFVFSEIDGIEVVHLRSPRSRDMGYIKRTWNEAVMSFYMRRNYKRSPFSGQSWDKVVWFAPSIFLAPLAALIRRTGKCQSYLILRDIFPEWALDLGLMRKGLPYWIFRGIAAYQYSVADVIGVQSPGELDYFRGYVQRGKTVEVLQNWISEPVKVHCSIDISQTPVSGRKILVYAGNIGIAQGADTMLELAKSLKDDPGIGLFFVGRGSHKDFLEKAVIKHGLTNVVLHNEIDAHEIPGLYKQCDAGIVMLDPRHKRHNIPGKFLSYMRSGLPVLASINNTNDLVNIIQDNEVGEVSDDNTGDSLRRATIKLLNAIENDPQIADRCILLGDSLFSPEKAVSQIIES